jgi:gluconolactonase
MLQRLITLLLLNTTLAFAQNAAPPSGSPDVLPSGSKLEQLFTGGVLTEGAAAAPDGTIYFSDITFTAISGMQAGHIMKFDPKTGKTSVYRSPSGMSNGIKFDAQGRMVVAEGSDYGGRRVTRTDMKTGKSEILAALFEGRPLNSPNDITIDLKGRIYFSDPRYLGYEPVDQPFNAVYRLIRIARCTASLPTRARPTGVAVSPDQKNALRGFQRQREPPGCFASRTDAGAQRPNGAARL